MKKWSFIICPLIMILVLVNFGFTTKSEVKVPEKLKVKEPTLVLFPKNRTTFNPSFVTPPFLGSCYIGFKEALAFKESQGDYFIINTLCYLGKYQFGIGTLQLMGVYNATKFLNDPSLQEKVFYTNISRNKWILRKYIKYFVGRKVKGVEVTESGILAAAHLAGPGNVMKYLYSNGRKDVHDAYGTSLADYLKKFSGYDISDVSAIRNPKV
ncbi:MAG: hypothetical protein WBN20_02140 [Eudoraea sp.]|uniref:hypothetical protein n=1 Tax=Eudoraea sp. TaxID=1979955 RepID=UPI003C74FCF0